MKLAELQANEKFKLTVLLSGGHAFCVDVDKSAPYLRQLVYSARRPHSRSQSFFFQIPDSENKKLHCFNNEQVVGLQVEPPVQLPTLDSEFAESVLSSEFVVFDEVLSAGEFEALFQYVLNKEREFAVAEVTNELYTGVDVNHRRSKVLFEFPEWEAKFAEKVRALYPLALEKLGLAGEGLGPIECQLTWHGSGAFFKVHQDNGDEDTRTRELTFVYYFFKEPQAFSGGELRVYDTNVIFGDFHQSEKHRDFAPRNNSIVFFLSSYWHEVRPVRLKAHEFSNGRFTLNGWVHSHE